MNNILVQSTNNTIATVNIEDKYTNTLSPETKRAYTQAIQEFFGKQLSEITVNDMQSVTPDHANQYALALENKGLTHATINRKLSALHSFYQFLCRRSVAIMNYNPFSTDEGSIRFKNAQKDYSDKKALTPEEVKKVLMSAIANAEAVANSALEANSTDTLALTSKIEAADAAMQAAMLWLRRSKRARRRPILAEQQVRKILKK